METTEALYTVSLQDYPSLPEHERSKAEARYARVLERQLGNAEEVMLTLQVLENLEDAPPDEISEESKARFHRWMKAARAAAEAGMQGLGEGESCFFEVKRGWRH